MNNVLLLGTARPEYAHPLPEWVGKLRETQVEAVRRVIEAFDRVDVVFLDAPVGTGKTLIGELVRREMGVTHGLYICTDRQLQDQVLRDFGYAQVLKGRSNYKPVYADRLQTCEDCQLAGRGTTCLLCPSRGECPYQVAKVSALGQQRNGEWEGGADLATLNTAYFLAAANHAHSMRKYDLVVADECDLLEGALTGFVEYNVPDWVAKRVGLSAPIKAARQNTLIGWLDEAAGDTSEWLARHGRGLDPKQLKRMSGFLEATRRMAEELRDDAEGERWIRDYGNSYDQVGVLKMRPVKVARQGKQYLWDHGHKWLCMSGTVVSGDEMADSLGWDEDFEVVDVDSGFPVVRRPIILAPIADIKRSAEEREYEILAHAIERILAEHSGRALVHTVSYALARRLNEMVRTPRRKIVYRSAGGKGDALDEYLATEDAVLFAPSMMRGVDLADDACRIQIIAKCPFPNLGDKQVAARLHAPGGQQWYAVKAIREVVQMTGRGVRHNRDWCHTYILDKQFTRNLWGRNKMLFPRYFREAVDERADIRWLIA